MKNIIKIDNSFIQIRKLETDELTKLINDNISGGKCTLEKKSTMFFHQVPTIIACEIDRSGSDDFSPVFRASCIYNSFTEPFSIPDHKEHIKGYWVIEQSPEYNLVNNYDRRETAIIIGLVNCITYEDNITRNINLSTKFEAEYQILFIAERLVRATKLNYVIEDFYKGVGRSFHSTMTTPTANRFQKTISKDKFKIDSLNLPNYIYRGDNSQDYDVIDFINDVVDNELYINLDSSRLSDGEEYCSIYTGKPFENNNIYYKDWVRVTAKLGNSTRANISLRYLTKIDVNIPENKFIEDKVITAYTERAVCIVKDGYLWTKEMLVKLTPDIVKKLETAGATFCVEDIIEGSYLVDLSSIPLIKLNRASAFSIEKCIDNKYDQHVVSNQIKFIDTLFLKDEKSTDPVTDEKDIFLSSLGVSIINGEYYFNDDITNKIPVEVKDPKTVRKDPNNEIVKDDIMGCQFSGKLVILKKVGNYDPLKEAITEYEVFGELKDFAAIQLFQPILDKILVNSLVSEKTEKTTVQEVKADLCKMARKLKNDRIDLRLTALHLGADISTRVTKFSSKNEEKLCQLQFNIKLVHSPVPYTSYKW